MSYKDAETVRADWSVVVALAVLCIPAAVIAIFLAAWKSLFVTSCVLLSARQMITTASFGTAWASRCVRG